MSKTNSAYKTMHSKVFALAAAALIALSCSSNDYTPQSGELEEQRTFTVSAISAHNSTKAANDAENRTYWEENDQIGIIADDSGEQYVLNLTEGAGTAQATFSGKMVAKQFNMLYAFFPIEATKLIDLTQQNGENAGKMVMYAKSAYSKQPSFTFNHKISVLKFKFPIPENFDINGKITVFVAGANAIGRLTKDGQWTDIKSSEIKVSGVKIVGQAIVGYVSVIPGSYVKDLRIRISDGTKLFVTELYTNDNAVIGDNACITLYKAVDKDPESGYFSFSNSDYTNPKYSYVDMFGPNEQRSVFYGRSFTTTTPLKVRIIGSKLRINFFSPIDITDVTILCKFKNHSAKTVKLGWFSTIKGFAEINIPLDITSRKCSFISVDGEKVVIPQIANLSAADCELSFSTEDSFMKRIKEIKYPIDVTFSPYTADKAGTNWAHLTPINCRHATVMAINMSYMFSKSQFDNKVNGWPGSSTTGSQVQLKDNNGNILPKQRVLNEARRIKKLRFGQVTTQNGVSGLGATDGTFGVFSDCFIYQYPSTVPTVSTRSIGNVVFHEIGHVMGYGHASSTMTHQHGWSMLCLELYINMQKNKVMPINDFNRNTVKWTKGY